MHLPSPRPHSLFTPLNGVFPARLFVVFRGDPQSMTSSFGPTFIPTATRSGSTLPCARLTPQVCALPPHLYKRCGHSCLRGNIVIRTHTVRKNREMLRVWFLGPSSVLLTVDSPLSISPWGRPTRGKTPANFFSCFNSWHSAGSFVLLSFNQACCTR